jgi:hypothetical protein
MAFGVTPEGFNRKTTSDLVNSINTRWRDEFGQDQDLSEDSPNGILIGLVSAEISESWQAAEDLYNQQNPNTSSGINQDNNAQLVGVTRNEASSTKVNISLKGDNATIIPVNTQISQSVAGAIFQNEQQGIISNGITNSIDLQVNSLQPSATYSLIINGIVYPYSADTDPTYDEIVDGLKALVDSANIGVTFTNNGDGAFNIESDDLNDTNNISATSLISIIKVQSILEFQSLEMGEIPAPATSIDTIDTSISGLDGVINFFDGQIGSVKETETELRIRREQSVSIVGASNAESIKSRLSNDIEGVSFVKVLDNVTLSEVDGVDPKSMEAIIEGGSDNDIANTLFVLKVGGISFDGNTSINITDSEGVLQTIKFSRPEVKFIWVKVTINSFNPEEALPTNYEQAIKDSIVNYAEQEFNISDDIILQKLYTPIYEISGIKSVTIEIAKTNTVVETPIYQTTDIAIAIRELGNFDDTRITIL